jgi:hypothetical protein
MFLKYVKTSFLLVSVLLLVLIAQNFSAGNYDLTYTFRVQYGLANHKLYVSIPSSLYEYYSGLTIKLADDNEYAKLVTPEAVKPIAENLRNLTDGNPRSDEEFANAALMLVHQIPYANGDAKYPIETLVENSGKCDTLSLLAASIMKAGGLDVVLLYFKGVHHINVGVYLPYEPHTTWWWLSPTGYEFEGRKYWVAECTPAMEWKVGDLPPLIAEEKPYVISLEDSEWASPAQVLSKLTVPSNSSSISIDLSSEFGGMSDEGRVLTISGSISPGYSNETVVVYFSQDGISYDAFRTVTDVWGDYSFDWNLDGTGTYYVRSSWSGNEFCVGADSELLTVFLGFPQSLIQFKGPAYYYIYGRAYATSHEIRARQGVEEFLDIQLSGTGVLLTGEFIIVKRGQIITIPRDGETKESLEEIVIPEGTQPLRLPYDIEQTTNNQFSLILRNNWGCNYTLNVKGLNNYDVTEISQFGGSGTTLLNTTGCITENTWYRLNARMSESKITAALRDVNGNLLESIATAADAASTNELVILLANNTERAVIFKNLRVEILDQTSTLTEGDEITADGSELLGSILILAILLVAILGAVVYAKKKTRVQR